MRIRQLRIERSGCDFLRRRDLERWMIIMRQKKLMFLLVPPPKIIIGRAMMQQKCSEYFINFISTSVDAVPVLMIMVGPVVKASRPLNCPSFTLVMYLDPL
ncbi:hypothetical protein BDBG_17778 [Blastomyces gilchristii SLH14081]|uniref:Uncharacterized protein n=1 Tax=Blastomyces gilchristii (strain SLH14081) TaxID=559298 RepID=A0A179V1H5_BLAGS|nr:uncharacterized protein BDBG_17778 [Blastomyces gilchristii SLH14081]OAT13309.1 hypothetical protein BDBG_17778 [Blastomyces gilchristii SLH14081]